MINIGNALKRSINVTLILLLLSRPSLKGCVRFYLIYNAAYSKVFRKCFRENLFSIYLHYIFILVSQAPLALLTYVIICDALHDLVSVTFWRLYVRSNAYECMLTLFLPFCCLYPFV